MAIRRRKSAGSGIFPDGGHTLTQIETREKISRLMNWPPCTDLISPGNGISKHAKRLSPSGPCAHSSATSSLLHRQSTLQVATTSSLADGNRVFLFSPLKHQSWNYWTGNTGSYPRDLRVEISASDKGHRSIQMIVQSNNQCGVSLRQSDKCAGENTLYPTFPRIDRDHKSSAN